MEENRNLTGYININDNQNYQFLYATQSYFSFFCVYAKFTKGKSRDNEGNEIDVLKSIDFFIKNYKGLTYEFKKIEPTVINFYDKTLRIGFEFTMFGGNQTTGAYKKEIAIKDIEKVFFTSDPRVFDEIVTCYTTKLIEYSKNPEVSNIIEDTIFSKSFLRLIRKVEDRFKDMNSMKKIFNEDGLAVGDNCGNSLLEVIGG